MSLASVAKPLATGTQAGIAAPSAKPAAALLDLRKSSNHPLSLRYSEIHDFAVIDALIEHGRAQPSLDTRHGTPFVKAGRRAISHGLQYADVVDVMVDELTDYYASVRPANAADWLGLGVDAHASLLASPPWAGVFPWRARTLASYRQAYEDAAWAENRAVGRDLGISDGWLFCGPVSQAKIRIEAERILHVLRRVASQGYLRSDDADGDVRATALVDDDHQWRWLITAGNHRASAAAALGFEQIPIRVNLVISRCDVAYWKHVVEGLFTQEQALTVFDNIFHARSTQVVRTWQARCGATRGKPT